MTRHNLILTLAALSFLALTTQRGDAETIVNYRLGEADAGATAGGAGNATTVEGIAGLDAARWGGPVYSSDTGVGYSSLSMDFDGSDDAYLYSGTALQTVTDNFILEAWVKPEAATGSVVQHGSNWDGFEINAASGKWTAYITGVTGFAGSYDVVLDEWQHVALVRANGTSTFYLNGVADPATTTSFRAVDPYFAIGFSSNRGGTTGFDPYNYLDGKIDEVKLFTFDAGTFNVSMLNQATILSAPPELTSITPVGGGVWELTLEGEADTGYEFRSSTTLDFTPGTLVESLTEVGPGVVTDGKLLTTDSEGDATVRMTLVGDPADFVRAQIPPPPPPPPPLLSEDFESGDGGFTLKVAGGGFTPDGSPWDHGEPNSTGDGGSVGNGNGGSANCWGTNIGLADDGLYANPTETCLRSTDIDLTGVTGAELTFAEALDIETNDTAVVKLINADGDVEIATVYTATDSDSSNAPWAPANGGSPIDLSAGAGLTVYLQWCLSGTGGDSDDYMGWYIDDVVVTQTVKVRAAAYNVLFGNWAYPERIGEMFLPYNLDIIAFCEVPDGDWTARVGAVLGMDYAYVGTGSSANHVDKYKSVLSRTPLMDPHEIMMPVGWAGNSLVGGTTTIRGIEVTFYSLHNPAAGANPAGSTAEYIAQQIIPNIDTPRFILMGDWNNHIGDAGLDVVENAGMRHTWEDLAIDLSTNSTYKHIVTETEGGVIDHIFFNAASGAHVTEGGINYDAFNPPDEIKPMDRYHAEWVAQGKPLSDHRPVWAEISFPLNLPPSIDN